MNGYRQRRLTGWVNQPCLVALIPVLMTTSVSQAQGFSGGITPTISISAKGADVLSNGTILVIGQPFAGMMTSESFTVEVGAAAILANGATGPLSPPLIANSPHDIRKNRVISINPNNAGPIVWSNPYPSWPRRAK